MQTGTQGCGAEVNRGFTGEDSRLGLIYMLSGYPGRYVFPGELKDSLYRVAVVVEEMNILNNEGPDTNYVAPVLALLVLFT